MIGQIAGMIGAIGGAFILGAVAGAVLMGLLAGARREEDEE